MACCCRKESSTSSTPFNPEWMTKLPKSLHSKPLNTLAIPGSHDSFSYMLDMDGGLAPNCPGFARDLCKVFGTAAIKILYNWSVTQGVGFYDQLIAGIRYLDLRVAVNKNRDGALYFCHGLYAQSVKDGLGEVQTFLKEHPKEVVLLDFNHFYSLSDTEHEAFVSMLISIFGSRLVPAQDVKQVTLENLWAKQQQVLVFYSDDATVKRHSCLWPDESIPSPWADTVDVGKLLHFLEENWQKGRRMDAFCVTQGILTPDSIYVIKHLFGSLGKDLCKKIVEPFLHWLTQKHAGKNGINICILDYAVQNDAFISTVIDLNNKYT